MPPGAFLADPYPVGRRKLQHHGERVSADEGAGLLERIVEVLRRGEAEPRARARISVCDKNVASSPSGGRARMPGVQRVGTVKGEALLVIGDELRTAREIGLEALVNGFRVALEPENLFVEFLVGQMGAAIELRLQRVGEDHRAATSQKRFAGKKIRDVTERHLSGENGVWR